MFSDYLKDLQNHCEAFIEFYLQMKHVRGSTRKLILEKYQWSFRKQISIGKLLTARIVY